MLEVSAALRIPDSELVESFVRASGPGGQNVNKVASAVELRFDAGRSLAIPADMMERLRLLAGSRMTDDGVIVIQADSHRTQTANRRDAIARLTELLRAAARKPRPRKPTHVSRAEKRRRLESKRRRGLTKRLRRTGDET